MIKSNVFHGYSMLESILAEFNGLYFYNKVLQSASKVIKTSDNIDHMFLNQFDYKDKDILNYIDDNDERTEYISMTNSFIDKLISFKPVLYRFGKERSESYLFLYRLMNIIEIDNIYGVILKYRDRNDFVNITHPLAMMNVIYSNLNMQDTFEYALIYPIDTNNALFKKEIENFDNELYESYKKTMIEILDKYISRAMIERTENKKEEKEHFYLGLTDYNDELVCYRDKSLRHITDDVSKFIIPCNIMCENHFIPQYIWLYLKLDKSGLNGRELISNKLISTNLSHTFSVLTKELIYVCNGAGNKYTYEGILNMLQHNVASQYSDKGIKEGFWTFVKANIDTSIYILNRFLKGQE